MKRTLSLLTVTGSVVVLCVATSAWWRPVSPGASEEAPSTTLLAGAANLHLKCVRAEYVTETNQTDAVDTELYIVNRSVARSIKLKTIVVVGAGGVANRLSTYNGLFDKVIPPLGEIVLPIDSTLPGVFPRVGSGRRPNDVASVIVTWEGPAEAMRLTATIFQWERRDSISGFGATSIVEGYTLTY